MKELYTFENFCSDRDILRKESHNKMYLPMWDVYGEDYIEYCKENDYDYENLNNLEG
jgi:hypothetical protein